MTDKPRRGRRTVLIMAVAVVLGVLGGAGLGYAVQQHRPPTPPPPLTVAQPRYPAVRVSTPPLPAADDDMVRTDGDLTKLLIPLPKGATVDADGNGWLSLSDLSETYTSPGSEFAWQLTNGFRRAARRSWSSGGIDYQDTLIQYEHDDENSALTYLTSQENYMLSDAGGAKYQSPIPGTVNGSVYAGAKLLHGDDGSVYYQGAAIAIHGDLAIEFYEYSPHPIQEKPLMALVQSQLERL